MKTYLTGASGFIGSKLRKALYDQDKEVTSIPHTRIYGYGLEPYERFFFLSTYGNMADHNDVSQVLGANINDLSYVLNESLQLNPGLFVYVSSSSVNLKHQTFYSNTKKAGELMVQSMSFETCIVRPFSIIGRGEQKEHLIPTLIRSCMEGTEMPFVPDATHDYVDVDDVVDGILMLSDQKRTGVFELGSGVEIRNYEVRDIVEAACGTKANTRTVRNLRSYDNQTWFCNNPVDGWKPKKTIETSVKEMVKAYQNENS